MVDLDFERRTAFLDGMRELTLPSVRIEAVSLPEFDPELALAGACSAVWIGEDEDGEL